MLLHFAEPLHRIWEPNADSLVKTTFAHSENTGSVRSCSTGPRGGSHKIVLPGHRLCEQEARLVAAFRGAAPVGVIRPSTHRARGSTLKAINFAPLG